eukprot:gene5956-33532_t
MVLYHMAQQELWEGAKSANAPYTPPTYKQVVFEPAAPVGSTEPGQLVSEDGGLNVVVFESAAPVGSTEPGQLVSEDGKAAPLFPHLFGPINIESVVEVKSILRDANGTFLEIGGPL